MSTGQPTPSRKSRWKFSPRTVSLLIVILVFLAVVYVQQLGWLQFLEFKVYDFLIRQQPKAATSDPIVLVEMTEDDIHSPSLDYPVHDDKLAQLLRNLVTARPAAIGLDIWRDIPVPKNGTGLDQFNEVLQAHSNIVAIFTLAGINPPAILGSNPDRIAFNDNCVLDVEVDHTAPKIRRSMLYGQKGDETQTFEALPLRLALLYLEPRGIRIEPDPDNSLLLRLGKAHLRAFQPSDGAYVRADTRGWQILIDFKCPDRFTRFSFGQVLAGSVSPEQIRDKIVLIGMNASSVSDEHATPIYRNHRGVEILAAMVNQLLRMALNGERSLQFWPDWIEHAWTLLWCGLGGVIGYCVSSPWRLGLTGAISLIGLAIAVWQAFVAGWWLPLIVPALGFVPATALVVYYVSFQERRDYWSSHSG
jgi:adenylate cyclase